MITLEDMHRFAMQDYEAELKDMTIEEAELALRDAHDLIDSETAWAEALTAYIETSR